MHRIRCLKSEFSGITRIPTSNDNILVGNSQLGLSLKVKFKTLQKFKSCSQEITQTTQKTTTMTEEPKKYVSPPQLLGKNNKAYRPNAHLLDTLMHYNIKPVLKNFVEDFKATKIGIRKVGI